MREVVVNSYCDRCVADGAHEPATETFTVAIAPGERPGKPHLVELCERHGKELYELTALVVEHGLPTEKLAPAATPAPGPRAIPSDCPIPGCGRDFPTRKALADHLRHVHRTTLGAVDGRARKTGTPVKCADCDFVAANGTGLSAHSRYAHPKLEPVPAPEPPPELMLTTGEAAKKYGVSRDVIRGGIRRGKLPASTDESGTTRVALSDLTEWWSKTHAEHAEQEEMQLT